MSLASVPTFQITHTIVNSANCHPVVSRDKNAQIMSEKGCFSASFSEDNTSSNVAEDDICNGGLFTVWYRPVICGCTANLCLRRGGLKPQQPHNLCLVDVPDVFCSAGFAALAQVQPSCVCRRMCLEQPHMWQSEQIHNSNFLPEKKRTDL